MKSETWTNGTDKGLAWGEKATLKPLNTPWSRPRGRAWVLMDWGWEARRDWILAASWGEPVEGKVAL